MAPAGEALAGVIRNGDALYPHCQGLGFSVRGVEAGIAGYQFRHPLQALFMEGHSGDEQVMVVRSLRIHFVSDDDLVFGFLNLDKFAELGRFAGFAFANNFRIRFKEADQLPFGMSIAVEHARLGLANDLPHADDPGIQFPLQSL